MAGQAIRGLEFKTAVLQAADQVSVVIFLLVQEGTMNTKKSHFQIVFVISTMLITGLALSGCQTAATESRETEEIAAVQPTPTEAPPPTDTSPPPSPTSPQPTPTEEPSPTPLPPTDTPEPTSTSESELGTERNSLIWAVVPPGDLKQMESGFEKMVGMIKEDTGLVITLFMATEYADVIYAMCSDPPRAHIGSLASFGYIFANENGCAEAELVSVRFGSSTYKSQIFTRVDSGLNSTADLKGVTFCRPNPQSTSGWIIPRLMLSAAGVNPDTDLAEVIDTVTHDDAIAAVYNGQCDAGASFVDARSQIEENYPDVMNVIQVIEVSIDIPNDGVQYVPSLDREIRDRINESLLMMSETEEGQEALDLAFQWSSLEAQDDTFYDPFRQLLSAAAVSP